MKAILHLTLLINSQSFASNQFSLSIVDVGVKEAIEADVTILRYLSWLVETVPGMTNLALSECVEEFSSLMMLQLDMKVEADNLDKFRLNFRSHSSSDIDPVLESSSYQSLMRYFLPMSISEFIIGPNNSLRRITFPEPLRPHVSPDILVESYEAGDQISDILDKMENKKLRRDIATAGLDAILKMVFEDNFIHAGESSVLLLSIEFISYLFQQSHLVILVLLHICCNAITPGMIRAYFRFASWQRSISRISC